MTSNTNSPQAPLRSVGGQDYRFVASYLRGRDPTTPNSSPDVKPKEQQGYYPISSLWTNTVNQNVWVLAGIINNLGKWVLISNGGIPALFKLGVPLGTSPINPDANGLINLTSTSGTIAITGSAGGLGAQNINFDVTGGSIIGKVAVDTSTPPGTNPVLPTANQITIEGGGVYPTGTRNNPIRTDSLAASTIDLEIQLAGSNAAVLTANKFGVSQFDSNQFDVNTGFVQLKGGGVNPALTKLAVQTGTSPVVPSATGQITFNGATVAAGTNPVRTDGTGVNTVALEVQISQAIAATDATKIGLAAFNSTQFTVDASGFVSTIASGTFNKIVRQVFTSNGTYTPTSGMKYCDVEIIGGGGGGGGSAVTPVANGSGGGGGGGGGYAKKVFAAATIGASQAVTIGGGGAAGAGGGATGGAGTTGTTSTFGALISATGGTGANGGTAVGFNWVTAVHVVGGVGVGGDFNIPGNVGEGGFSFVTMAYGGNGGNSFYGSGAAVTGAVNGAPNAGNPSFNYGAGGSGGASCNGDASQSGSAGTAGICIVTEYCG